MGLYSPSHPDYESPEFKARMAAGRRRADAKVSKMLREHDAKQAKAKARRKQAKRKKS